MDSESTLGVETEGAEHAQLSRQLQRRRTWRSNRTRRTQTKESELSVIENPEVESLKHATESLCDCITGQTILTGMKAEAWDWFLTSYCDSCMRSVWTGLIVPVVEGISHGCDLDDSASKIKMYNAIRHIVTHIEQSANISLFDIDARMRMSGIFKPNTGTLSVQLVFQVLGWLTTCFEPSLHLQDAHETLHLKAPLNHSRRYTASVSQIFRSMTLNIEEARSPIHTLLSLKFGKLLPTAGPTAGGDIGIDVESGAEMIRTSNIYFDHLQQDLKVTVKWTMTLNEHLIYDGRTRSLSIYKSPSICYLLYRNSAGTIMSKIYEAYLHELRQSPSGTRLRQIPMEGYFAEVLLSYLLLFAGSKTSRKSINRILLANEEMNGRNEVVDPLLTKLCTKDPSSSETRELLLLLEGYELQEYVSVEEFPFLGNRLLHLQRLSQKLSPHHLSRLWNDRRDIATWFAIWAVVILGGGSVVLQMLSLAFQMIQVWLPQR